MRKPIKKDDVITIRVNEEQKNVIKRSAKAKRMSLSKHILNCVLSPKVTANEQQRVEMEMTLIQLQVLVYEVGKIKKSLENSKDISLLGQESLDAMIGEIKRTFEILRKAWGIDLCAAKIGMTEKAQIDYPDEKLVVLENEIEMMGKKCVRDDKESGKSRI
jgi:hypothetical protein